MRVSKWWQNFHFGVNYPFNEYDMTNTMIKKIKIKYISPISVQYSTAVHLLCQLFELTAGSSSIDESQKMDRPSISVMSPTSPGMLRDLPLVLPGMLSVSMEGGGDTLQKKIFRPIFSPEKECGVWQGWHILSVSWVYKKCIANFEKVIFFIHYYYYYYFIKVKLWYDKVGHQLIVNVLQARELPPRPDGRPRNPYVKMYFLPDRR